MSEVPAIKCSNIWKRYGLHPVREVKDWIALRKNGSFCTDDENGPWALRGVDFEIKKGECLGVVGRNGAGKSTLLKLLAGVSKITHGSAELSSLPFSMLELTAGINPELSGRENSAILAAVMGVRRKNISDVAEKVKEFSELGEWFERPVRKYSSGMRARLGFAVAINVKTDILLIDEVLSVGDLSFQRKCFNTMAKIKEENSTIVFVSHNIRQIERFCDKAIYLDKGSQLAFGDAADICEHYMANNFLQEQRAVGNIGLANWDNNIFKILRLDVKSTNGEVLDSLKAGEDFILEFEVEFDMSEKEYFMTPLILTNEIMLMSALSLSFKTKDIGSSGRAILRFHYKSPPFMPGIYNIGFTVKNSYGCRLGTSNTIGSITIEHAEYNKIIHPSSLVCLDVDFTVSAVE